MRYLDGMWWIWGQRMTKQELIEKYKAFKEGNKIYIKSFKRLDKTKVECAKSQIKLLNLVIKDLKKLD